NRAGAAVAIPDQDLVAKAVHPGAEATSAPPKVADLHDPVISGLVAAYQDRSATGSRVYKADGRTYIASVAELPARYGRDQLLAIAVPMDEIEQPITEIRNQTLLYSTAFLIFALPLYATLIIAWIDRRLRNT